MTGPVPATAADAVIDWPFRPVTFGRGEAPDLFGFYHPAQGRQRRCGVVLCNAFAYDLLGPHRSYRALAERLASDGYPVLRFDYHGTGDSAGSDADPQRLSTWLADIGTAIERLKDWSGVTEVALYGVRLGASLAVMAAATRDDVRALMLWAPDVNGRHVTRQLRLLHGTSAAIAAAEPGEAASASDGAIEAAGFRHSAETLEAIGSINLLKMPRPTIEHIVLLDRDDVAPDDSLVESWSTAGPPPDRIPVAGFAGMMRDPHAAVIPRQAIDALVAWLGGKLPAFATAATARSHEPPWLLTSTERGGRLRETPTRFGNRQQLFGIVSQSTDVGPSEIGVIFVNAGGNHRVGPSRFTVPLARHIASLGHTVLRMDIAGFGDSVSLPGPLPIFKVESVADIRQAIDHLETLDNGRLKRFVVVGLCSGGFLSYHAVQQDDRINGQITLNLPQFEWHGGESDGESIETFGVENIRPLGAYVQGLLSATAWKRLLTGDIDIRLIAKVGTRRLLHRLAVQLQRLSSRFVPGEDTSVAGRFASFSKRGVRSLMILSAKDGAIDEMETQLGKNAQRLAGDPNFTYVVIDGADHTFTASRCREQVLDIIGRFFETLSTTREPVAR